jgi:hypothetical protein
MGSCTKGSIVGGLKRQSPTWPKGCHKSFEGTSGCGPSSPNKQTNKTSSLSGRKEFSPKGKVSAKSIHSEQLPCHPHRHVVQRVPIDFVPESGFARRLDIAVRRNADAVFHVGGFQKALWKRHLE